MKVNRVSYSIVVFFTILGLSALDTEPPEMPDFSIETDLERDEDEDFANFESYQTHHDDDLAFPDVDQSSAATSKQRSIHDVTLTQSQSATSLEFSGWSRTGKLATEDNQSEKSLDFKNAVTSSKLDEHVTSGAAVGRAVERLSAAAAVDSKSTASYDAK